MKVIVQNLDNITLELKDQSETILVAAQLAGQDWMQACGGQGRCTTCQCEIIEGAENLFPETEIEQTYRSLSRLAENHRLACQTKIKEGVVVVKIPEKTKLKHLTYYTE